MAKKKTKKKKTTKKKVTARRATTKKKTTRKKKAASTVSMKFPRAAKARSKSEIFGLISDKTELSKKQVGAVFDTMSAIIASDLKGGPKMFTVPGLMKITVKRKPATKARKGINPFTGEEMMFKAKPARNLVKIRALKALKEMV